MPERRQRQYDKDCRRMQRQYDEERARDSYTLAEQERCAQVAETIAKEWEASAGYRHGEPVKNCQHCHASTAREIARKIRERV